MSSTTNHPAEPIGITDLHAAELHETRRKARRERNDQVAALYPHVRTFTLKHADAVNAGAHAARAAAEVPQTLTLVTPDLDDPSRDHLFVGQYPVLSKDVHWDAAFEELSFSASDGSRTLRGNFRVTHSRLRAHGVLDIGGEPVSVEYAVDPQRYRMKVAKDAAYLSGQAAQISWDPDSDRWKKAAWSADYEAGFTWGVNGEEVIGDEKVYTFVASFDDVKTGRKWTPVPFSYGGYMTRDQTLIYGLISGGKTPTGPGSELFPYSLRCRLSEFGYDFTGGMVVGEAGYKGTVYGVIGDWAGAHIGGMYRLHGEGTIGLVSVHGRTLYAGTTPAARTEIDGDVLTWSGLPETAAAGAGIPTSGHFVFAPDGSRIVGASFGGGLADELGTRVHADELVHVSADLGDTGLAQLLRHAHARPAEPGHELSDLLRMTQFAVDDKGDYYDRIQSESMEDFYKILQNYMDADLRKTFFHATPPVLSNELRAIAQTKGSKGTEPLPWFAALSVPYTASCLGKWSDDPYAKTLNIVRSESWLSQTTSSGDVMTAQGPLLYQRRYQEKHQNLDWFLTDQIGNAAKYAPAIDAKEAEWLKQAKDNNVGTPEQLAEMEKQIKELAAAAKKNKQYWAFAVYSYTMTPAYLNMLQTIIASGVEIDGSEFSQRVQRTVALLNVLDTSSYFSRQYAYTLQLFQLGSILPQMIDMGADLEDFNFVVKQIIDKFIETYIDAADPAMREAAEALREHASRELVGKMLAIMRSTASVGYGLFNWGFLAQTFEKTCAKVLAKIPAIVIKVGAIAIAGTLLSFFLTGQADWNSLTETQKAYIVLGGMNLVALNTLAMVKYGVALSEIWRPVNGIVNKLKLFWKVDVLAKAQETATAGFRGFLLQEVGPKIPTAKIPFTQWWAQRSAVAAEQTALVPRKGAAAYLGKIFGKNMSQFLARALAGAFAITGIVLSAIDLANSKEPLERAAHAMFLIASVLELVAVVGAWAVAGSAVTVFGMAVSAIFSVVSVIGFVALAIGAILLIILMTRPQPTPVETFAKERAGGLYMPFKAAIESFRLYQPLGQPQRSGIGVFPLADKTHALRIGSDGKVTQAAFDSTGHTAFYLKTDDQGRAQIGAPIMSTEDKPVLQSLGTDDAGAVTSKNYVGDNLKTEPKLLWYADILGEGTYEEVGGVKELKAAPFRLRSVYWEDDKKATRYLATDGTTGWRLTGEVSEAAILALEMVATKPAELSMNDVSWFTIAHDELAAPALQIPGSLPRKWTVSPALPEGIELNPAEGTIAMRPGVDVPPAVRRDYTLTVTNDLGAVHTTFALEVVVPEEELVLA